jgi:ribosomal protein L12E/L44/L45/RPP1/RPP2
MALNFGILSQVPSFGQQFAAGQQAAQAQQERNMLRQQQAEQMQFQRENMLAQREDRAAVTQERQARQARAAQRQQFLTGAAEALAQGGQKLDRPTLTKVLQSGIQADEPSLVQFAREGLKALDEEELYQRESQRLSAAPGAAPTREEVQNMLRSPSPRMREQGKALLPTLPTPEKPMVVGGNLVSPTGQVLFTAPEKPRSSQLLTPEEEAQKTRIALASRPPPQPREPREPPAPIPVVDPATGQVKYVPRDQAVGMTPPQFTESLTPKERQSREAKFPQATSAVKTFETTSNTLIKDLETLAKHPGLSSITGIAAGRLPGITSAGREAEALFDKISARGGFQELQNMRQASPTGGALGNVSNQEGAQLRQAFAALDRRQDAASVRKAISDAINQIRASQQTIKEAYDMTYEYKQGGGAAPAPASPNIDALLNKYK